MELLVQVLEETLKTLKMFIGLTLCGLLKLMKL